MIDNNRKRKREVIIRKIRLLGILLVPVFAFAETVENNVNINAVVDKYCIFYYESKYEIGIVESPATNVTFNLDETVNIPFGFKCTKDTSFTFKMINDTWQESVVKVTGIKMSSPTTNDFLSGIIRNKRKPSSLRSGM